MRTILVAALVAGMAGEAGAQEDDLYCGWLEETEKLAAEVCECTKIKSAVERLDCFDEAATIPSMQLTIAEVLARRLSDMPGGLGAMREALRGAVESD